MVILVRKTSGEVLGSSTDNAVYSGADPAYFQAVLDPPVPDGQDLSVRKIWTGAVMRNATAPELATFAPAAAVDLNLHQRTRARDYFQSDPVLRKTLRAIAGLTTTQLNTLRALHGLAALTRAQVEQAIVDAIAAGTYD